MTPEQKFEKEKGGYAFACGNPEQGGDPGMTLRDYFAGQALAGLVSKTSHLTHDTHAELAYQIADAMLKQRNGG